MTASRITNALRKVVAFPQLVDEIVGSRRLSGTEQQRTLACLPGGPPDTSWP